MNETSTILLVEDDEGHATLLQRNLKRAGIADDICRVGDGQEAIDYINGDGRFSARQPGNPRVVLLDINMPRRDGVEVLRHIKQDENARTIPVVMVTTTDDPREIDRCYQLGCNAYVRKPVEYDGFIGVINALGAFLQILSTPGTHIEGTTQCVKQKQKPF